MRDMALKRSRSFDDNRHNYNEFVEEEVPDVSIYTINICVLKIEKKRLYIERYTRIREKY